MDSQDAMQIFNTMTSENIVYAFHGDFNYTVVNTLLIDVKKQLHKNTSNVRTAKKTYKVLVECLENIHKHSSRNDENKEENNEGIFILQKKEDAFIVAIGNSIQRTEVVQLKTHLDEINSLDAAALKAKYRETLLTTEVSEKGGAGMGMIDIAMKSGSILDYTFSDYTESKQFFSLQVLVQG